MGMVRRRPFSSYTGTLYSAAPILCVKGTSEYFTLEEASGDGGRMSSSCVEPRRYDTSVWE